MSNDFKTRISRTKFRKIAITFEETLPNKHWLYIQERETNAHDPWTDTRISLTLAEFDAIAEKVKQYRAEKKA